MFNGLSNRLIFESYLFRTTVELFSFALTNMEGKLTFGFARHAPRAQSALVVVSALPWHDFFYKLLNNCAQIINNPGGEEEPG